MGLPKLARLELQIMEILWQNGPASVREIQAAFPVKRRPAFTTIGTTIYRMEGKGAVRCSKKVGNANIFEAAVSREDAENRLIDDLLDLLGRRTKPIMARLVNSGNLTLEDVQEAEQVLREMARKKGKAK
jgi:predicted transcriptional regulator